MHREPCFWLVIKAMRSTSAMPHILTRYIKSLKVNFLSSCMSAIRSLLSESEWHAAPPRGTYSPDDVARSSW